VNKPERRVGLLQSVEKPVGRLVKKVSCEAREKSTSGGVLAQYVVATRLSARKQRKRCPTILYFLL
jgi:hypothetical protein